MEENIESILKEFEGFTPNEKIKYTAKQQEEFLKNIDSRKLIEKIRKFRVIKTDIRNPQCQLVDICQQADIVDCEYPF